MCVYLLNFKESLINTLLGIHDELFKGVEHRHLLLVDLVFDQGLVKNKLIQTVSEPYSTQHLPGASLDPFSTLIDTDGRLLTDVYCVFHVGQRLLELQFSDLIVLVLISDVLPSLELHSHELLDLDACSLDFGLDAKLLCS